MVYIFKTELFIYFLKLYVLFVSYSSRINKYWTIWQRSYNLKTSLSHHVIYWQNYRIIFIYIIYVHDYIQNCTIIKFYYNNHRKMVLKLMRNSNTYFIISNLSLAFAYKSKRVPHIIHNRLL